LPHIALKITLANLIITCDNLCANLKQKNKNKEKIMANSNKVMLAFAFVICIAILSITYAPPVYAQAVGDGDDTAGVVPTWEWIPTQPLEPIGFTIRAWNYHSSCRTCCGYMGSFGAPLATYSHPAINRPGRNNVINLPIDIQGTSFFNSTLGGLGNGSNWYEWGANWASDWPTPPLGDQYRWVFSGYWSVHYRMFYFYSVNVGSIVSWHDTMRPYCCCRPIQIGPYGPSGFPGTHGYWWAPYLEPVFPFYFL